MALEHLGPISGIAAHPSGSFVATAGYDGQVIVWDTSIEGRRAMNRARRPFGEPASIQSGWKLARDIEQRLFRPNLVGSIARTHRDSSWPQ